MNFRILGLLAVFALPGCSTFTAIQSATVDPQKVVIAANSFDAVEVTATNYLTLPKCPDAKVCKSSAVVAKLVPAVKEGRVARNKLEAFMLANPNQPVPVSGYDTLMTAVTSAQGLLAAYNAK